MIRTRETAPHYIWGEGCDGWRWCDTQEFSVIRETMPPGTAEERHRHAQARQVFHVLTGTLTLEMDGIEHRIGPDEAIEVPPGAPHQAMNRDDGPLNFLVISSPSTRDDREPAP